MTLTAEIASAMPGAKQYAVDRGTRAQTRQDYDLLTRLDESRLSEIVDDLRRGDDPSERALAALLAARLPTDKAAEPLLAAVARESDPQVLTAVAEALGSLPGADWSEQLRELADRHNDEPSVLRAVATALYKREDAAAFDALLRLARDPDVDTRAWAAWALADGFPQTSRRDEALRAYLRSAPETQLTTAVRRALEEEQNKPPKPGPRPSKKRRGGREPEQLLVLVASANPLDTDQLALDEEVRAITAGLRATPARDIVDLRTAWALRPTDLLRELNEYNPGVLHFSGHGTPDGRLVFLDSHGDARPIDGRAIAATVRAAGESVRVVVLNACFSAELARELTVDVDAAVGMDRPVGDDAARVFAEAFYSALGYGSSVGRAFDQGRAALMLEGIPEDHVPQLATRDGVDPYELVLVNRVAVRPVDPHLEQRVLREVTAEHLSHLEKNAYLPLAGGIRLQRALATPLHDRAEEGSLLVLGPPGAGKTGALFEFASRRQSAGRDVVVLAADLLKASGRRSLSEELGLELDVVDVLAGWRGDEPGFLVVDALDAARGGESIGVLLDLIDRVATRAGRWHVVASVRSFDLRHNPALQAAFPARGDGALEPMDPEFPAVRHVAVAGLTDTELAGLQESAPDALEFLHSAAPALKELARVPFNLRLLVLLLARGTDRVRLGSVRTQLELLDMYWEVRVIAGGPGQDARQWLATRVCEEAIASMRLRVPRARLREAAALGNSLDQLLQEGVLVEMPAGTRVGESIGFAHHVLFDYAVHRLLLSGEPDEIAARLSTDDELVLLARPSLVMTLVEQWGIEPGRMSFWLLALRLAAEDVPVAARIVAPAVVVDEAEELSDLTGLLRAVDAGDPAGLFLLSHTVGARVALGQPSRPLAGRPDLRLWSAFARELGHRLRQEIAYPLRLLIWGLSADHGQLEEDERLALGVAARALLDWAWGEPDHRSIDVGVALEAVARTCATDPPATRRLLLRVVDPERIPRYGSEEIRRLAEELRTLTVCVPDVVSRLYEAVYAYDEDSEEPTALGSGQILRLTSTRRQDWEMVRYALAQEYPGILEADIRTGVRVLAFACGHEARDGTGGRTPESVDVALAGRTATIDRDSSHYWDSGSVRRDVSSMLDAFQQRLVEIAEADHASAVEEVFDALAERPLPAAIWRRVIRAAANARLLARGLADLFESVEVLAWPELEEPICQFLSTGFLEWTDDERRRVERAILGLPAALPADRREAAEYKRDQLIGCLPAGAIQTDEVLRRAREMDAGVGAPSPPRPLDFSASWGAIDEAESLRERGIEPAAPANERLLQLIAPVSRFAGEYSNAAPSTEAADAALPDIEALRAGRAELSAQASPQLVNEAEAWLSEAAAPLAWQTPLPIGARSVALARELATAGARGVIPDHAPEDLEQFDRGGPSWGVPSGRIDAARALLLLCREPEAVNEAVFNAIRELAHDAHPAVRWSVARWLGLARVADPTFAWTLIDEIADREPSSQVLQALLHSVLRFGNDDLDRVMATARRMYLRERRGERREALMRALAQFMVEFWVWRGHPLGRQLVDEWLERIGANADLARSVLISLRDPVTHGGDEPEQAQIRQRAIGTWADLSRAAGDVFGSFDERRQTGAVLESDEQDVLREVAHLLDSSATELYFASGAYAEGHKEIGERLKPDVRERFYREADRIFEVLVSIGLPSIAHHVLQTLATFVDLDPRGVLLRIGRLLSAGQSWGYQLESLAESEFVRLVERYLASHRDLFMRDRQSREVLVTALQGFVDAGWPSARRLLYGLDDMFR